MVTSAQHTTLDSPAQWSAARPQQLLGELDKIVDQQDPTLGALHAILQPANVHALVIGGIAVISHGYARTTADRDLLISRDGVLRLVEALEASPDWRRLEDKEFSFLHLPTNCPVDFVVAGDLAAMGLIAYHFPQPSELTSQTELAGVPVVGLDDLIYLKLLAGRMRDHADIMELCKRHMDTIDFESILTRLDAADDTRREKLAEIREQAPLELAAEKKRNWPKRDAPDNPAGTNNDSTQQN